MKIFMAWLFLLISSSLASAQQHTFSAKVIDADTKKPLKGVQAKIVGTTLSSASDSLGVLSIPNIPSGQQTIEISAKGYVTIRENLNFPLNETSLRTFSLEHEQHAEELEEVTISATRSSRTIDHIPTRVEVIVGEELDEKSNMKPGDIRMLLAESTGIQTQQTSATSANSSIRIQGLDGKYTQIIRDGMPLYAGFSGGLSLLQIAPLDLQQVEVIKGSSSTLYGGGAIAGLVNLVSKKPSDERQLNFLLNGTSALGLDASGFYAEKFNKIGISTYAAYNLGTAYDPADIGLTAIPQFHRFTLNPKVYFYLNEKSSLTAGINAMHEDRLGGDINYIKHQSNSATAYFEKNKTERISSQLEFTHRFNEQAKLTFKNGISLYDRAIKLQNYQFSGRQITSFTEANYAHQTEKSDWIIGLNWLTDQFDEDKIGSNDLRNYNYTTLGGFVQNTVDVGQNVSIETGLRGDYHNEFGFIFLPRLSTLWKINSHFSTRLGGGLGYKAPTIFTEEAERIQFRHLKALNLAYTKLERSYGGNFDINFQTPLFNEKVSLSINHMFFYTRLNNPIFLGRLGANPYEYFQPKGNLNTKGMETNAKITFGDFKLFIGYTYADVNQKTGNSTSAYPLVSKHRLNNVLMYEVEEKWKVGAEAYYFSSQQLSNGDIGKSYWTMGFLAERIWEKFSLFINFENFTDTRQTKFGPIYTGPISSPIFNDIYAPVDGFVMNGGIKLRL